MSGGVAAALEEAMKGEAGMADVVQAGLFDDLEPHETGALDAPSPLSAALPSVARRGRPPRSKNRRTEAVTAWLLSQHRHPLSVMMEAYSMSTVELAERLGLSRDEDGQFTNDVLLDLFKLQVRMAEAVAPYVAQRLSAGSDAGGAASFNLTFAQLNVGGGGVSGPARGEGLEFSPGEGMSVRLGQVGQVQSDADPSS
jgi:hypothetical protein